MNDSGKLHLDFHSWKYVAERPIGAPPAEGSLLYTYLEPLYNVTERASLRQMGDCRDTYPCCFSSRG
jgi:hypothetical protein